MCSSDLLIFTQIGTSFTMNTTQLAGKQGICLVSSLDIADVRPGLEMVKAHELIAQSRILVLKGGVDREKTFGKIGTRLKYAHLRKKMEKNKLLSKTARKKKS